MHLGDMTGMDLARQLARPGACAAPCVVLSADAVPERGASARRDAGFTDYLTKPLDVAALMRCMDRLLGSPKTTMM